MHRQSSLTRRTFRRTLLKFGAATAVGAVIAASAVVPAQAATGDVTQAEGVLLSGAGIVNVDSLAQLKGAYSSSTATSSLGTVNSPLDVTALSSVGVGLGNGLQLVGPSGILKLGVVGQYAATSATSSTAASGLVGSDGSIAVNPGTPGGVSTLDLTALLRGVGASTQLATTAQLDVGALASRITAQRGSAVGPTSSYGIAGADVTLVSPAVAGLTTSLQTAVNTTGTTLGTLTSPSTLGPVLSGTTGGLTTALSALLGNTVSLNGTTITGSVTGLSLGNVVAPILGADFTSGAVTISPSTGKVVIDLNALDPLNGRAANTNILTTAGNPAALRATIQTALNTALSDILTVQIPTAINSAVQSAVELATVNLQIKANVATTVLGLTANILALNIDVSTSLGNALKTTGRLPLTVNATSTALGTGLAISSDILNPLLAPVLNTVLAPLVTTAFTPIVTTATTTLASTLSTTLTPVVSLLGPVLGLVNQVVRLTVNAQDGLGFQDARGDDPGSASVHALQLSILPGVGLATVNLATSTVRSTAVAPVAITTPTASPTQQFIVATATATRSIPVTGTGEPGATVSVDLGGGRTTTALVGAGGTWSASVPGIGVGTGQITVSQTFGASTTTDGPRAFVVAAQQPLVITAPTQGRAFTVVSASATTPVTISGTATAGSTIALDLGRGITASTTTLADGTWSTVVPAVPTGSYKIAATQTSGGVTSAEATRDFSVAAGQDLTVATPVNGAKYIVPGAGSTTTVTVTGSAQPGATVTVSLGGALTGTVVAAADGTWSIPVEGVGTGAFTVAVKQTVAGADSATVSRSISVKAADPILITSPFEGASFTVAGPTATTPVTVSGTAQAGAAVSVTLATGISASTTADVNGNWSVPFTGVAPGDYTISATETVAGATSDPVTRAISVVPAAAVVISTPRAGTVDVVAEASSTVPVEVAGKAEPLTDVTVTLDANHSATVTSGADGSWSTTFAGIRPGVFTIQAFETVGGVASTPVARVYEIAVGAPVAITRPADPGVPITVAAAGQLATVQTAGTAQPGASVTVTIGTAPAVTTTALADGSWTASVPGVAVGTPTLSVQQTVPGTSPTTSTPVTDALTVSVGAPIVISQPALTSTVTVVGADGTTSIVVSGTAQPGAAITASVGLATIATTASSATGAWTATFEGVGVGTYSVDASQTLNGTTSTTAPRTVRVEVGTGIVITQPAAGSTFRVADGASGYDATVSGTAQPGSSVEVGLTGQDTVTVDADATTGAWSASFPDLEIGSYTATAVQTLSGVDTPANPVSFAVAVADDVSITTPTPTTPILVAAAGQKTSVPLHGLADPAATVTVRVDGQGPLTVTRSANGAWSAVSPELVTGLHEVEVTQSINGTTSAEVTSAFTIRAAAPFTLTSPATNPATFVVADGDARQTVTLQGDGQIGSAVTTTLSDTAGVLPDITKTTTVGMNGTWSIVFPAIAVGSYTAVSTEAVGTTTAGPITTGIVVKAAAEVSVSTPASGTPIVVADGAATTTVTITGLAQPNTPVFVDLGTGTPIEVTADGTGTWTATTGPLGTGSYSVQVTQTVNGTTSLPITSSFGITAGAALVVEKPTQNARITIADDDVRVALPVSGTAQPGARVIVTLENGLTASTTADATTGAWSTTVAGVGKGAHTVSVTQTIAAVAGLTTATVSAEATVDVLVAPGAPLVVVTPTSTPPLVVATAGSKIDVPVAGTAQPFATIRLVLDGGATETTTADGSGNWSFVYEKLGVDSHTVAVSQTVGTTTSTPVEVAFTIAKGDDLVVSAPTNQTTVVVPTDATKGTVAVTGTGQEGARVTATLETGAAESTTVGADGTWSIDLPDVALGGHTVSVSQTVGGTISPITERTITVVQAAAISLTSPSDGAAYSVSTATAKAKIVITGEAQPNTLVTVSLGDDLSTTVTADEAGHWTAPVLRAGVGTYTVTATQTIAGVVATAPTRSLTVGQAEAATIEAPASGTSIPVALSTSTVSVPVSGTAQPGTTVDVSLDGGTPVRLTIGDDGTWSTVFPNVGPDAHTVTVIENASDGPLAAVTRPFSVDVAKAVEITSPADGQQLQVTPGTKPDVTVAGLASPGATVVVTFDDTVLPEVTADETGLFTVVVPSVEAGPHTVSVVQTIGTDSQPATSSGFSVVETTTPVAAVKIDRPLAGTTIPDTDRDGFVEIPVSGTGQAGSSVVATLDDGTSFTALVGLDGKWAGDFTRVPVGSFTRVAVVQLTGTTPTSSDQTPVTSTSVAVLTISQPTPGTKLLVSGPLATLPVTVSGRGQTGAAVSISLGAGLTANTTVKADGTYSVDVPAVPVGTYTVTARQSIDTVAAGSASSSVQVAAAAAVAIVAPADLSTVVVATRGDTVRIPVRGSAQPGATVTVRLNGVDATVVEADANGVWSTSFSGVGAGTHTVSATQQLDSGTTTPVTATVTVRLAAPAAVTTPRPGQVVQVPPGGRATVVTTGTGEPGASMSVDLDSGTPVVVTVSNLGTWTATFANVAPGAHSVSATQTVVGTTQDAVTRPFTVVAVAAPVAQLAVTSPAPGTLIVDTDGNGTVSVPVTGSGQPGSIVKVDAGNGRSVSVTVPASGNWSATVTGVPVGRQTLTVTQTTGSTVTGSASIAIVVDGIEPVAITAPKQGQSLTAPQFGTVSYTAQGTAEPGSKVSLSLDNGDLVVVKASADGTWSLLLDGLDRGDHTLTATETVGGATSAPTSVAFTVVGTSTTTPITVASPAEQALIDDQNGDGFENVPVSGTATPGATITVTLDDGEVLTTTAAADGTWRVRFLGVATGMHRFTAAQTVLGLTTAAPTRMFLIADVRDVAIAGPTPGTVITAAADGTATVPLMGVAHPGARVEITLDDGRSVFVVANADGVWSTSFTGVKAGPHVFTVRQWVNGFASDPVTTAFSIARSAGNPIDPGDGSGSGGSGSGGSGSGTTGSGSGTGTVVPAGTGSTTTPTPTSVTQGVLAFTGSDVLPWASVGAGILALGLAMLGASRALSRFRAKRR